jgi:hypothetical protein
MNKRIIKNYKDLGEMSLEDKIAHYEISRTNPTRTEILDLVPNGKSVWFDNRGQYFSKNAIVFEQHKWKQVLQAKGNDKDVYFYKNFFSPTMVGVINRYIKPASVVINHSTHFKYVTPEELTNNLKFLIDSYRVKILVSLNMLWIDFNKIKYTNQSVVNQVLKELDYSVKAHKFHEYPYDLYIFESM